MKRDLDVVQLARPAAEARKWKGDTFDAQEKLVNEVIVAEDCFSNSL